MSLAEPTHETSAFALVCAFPGRDVGTDRHRARPAERSASTAAIRLPTAKAEPSSQAATISPQRPNSDTANPSRFVGPIGVGARRSSPTPAAFRRDRFRAAEQRGNGHRNRPSSVAPDRTTVNRPMDSVRRSPSDPFGLHSERRCESALRRRAPTARLRINVRRHRRDRQSHTRFLGPRADRSRRPIEVAQAAGHVRAAAGRSPPLPNPLRNNAARANAAVRDTSSLQQTACGTASSAPPQPPPTPARLSHRWPPNRHNPSGMTIGSLRPIDPVRVAVANVTAFDVGPRSDAACRRPDPSRCKARRRLAVAAIDDRKNRAA